MNKLKIATIISASLFTCSAFATDKIQHLLNMLEEDMSDHSGQQMTDKIFSNFDELDDNNNGYIDRLEASNNNIQHHFDKIDEIGEHNGKISRYELNTYAKNYGLQVIGDRELLGEKHYNVKTNYEQNNQMDASMSSSKSMGNKELVGEKHYNVKTNYGRKSNTDTSVYLFDDMEENDLLGEKHYELKTNYGQKTSYKQNTEMDKIVHSFQEIDDDDNGSLSVEETDDHNISMHFGYIDDNEDKVLSYKEYITYLAESGYVTEQ